MRRVKLETEVSDADDVAERRLRGIGRPSKAAPFAEQVRAWLAEAPDLPTLELLRRAKDQGYAGNKTAFYAMVAGVRPPRAAPVDGDSHVGRERKDRLRDTFFRRQGITVLRIPNGVVLDRRDLVIDLIRSALAGY